jgi:acetyltransferase
MVEFHGTLSNRTDLRYLYAIGLAIGTLHERLARICWSDYQRETVLVADYAFHPGRKPAQQVASGRRG